MKVKEEREKAGLKLNIQKTKIMALVPSFHGKQMGKKWKQWHFIFLGSKISPHGDCSHEIKRHLLLGTKVMTNLDNILKSRDITLLTKVCLVKVMVFSSSHVWVWELDYKESWAPKNWRFRTVVLEETIERLLWIARRSSQSVLKEISPDYSLEGLMLKLKLQYFDFWCEELTLGKDPDAGKDWRQRRRGWQKMR